MTIVLSDSSNVNSYGFRIDLDGLDTKRFLANPVMCYQHDTMHVIGRWDNLRKEDGRLLADPVFDMEDELAAEVAGKVERGFLKGCSIGMLIKEMVEKEGEKVATKAELLEASIVSIPSDPGAVVLYDNEHNQLSVEDFQRLSLDITIKQNTEMENQEEMVTLQAELEDVKNLVATNADEIATLNATISDKDAQLAEKDAKIAELEAVIASKDEEAKVKEINLYLNDAVKAGKINEAEKEQFAKLANLDFETVKAIIDAKQAPAPATSLREAIQVTASLHNERSEWTYFDWLKNDSKGLRELKENNPAEYERLAAEYKTKNN